LGEQQTGDLRQVRIDKLNDLINSGRNPFKVSKYEVTSNTQYIKDNYDEMEGKTVSIAGRIMSKRGQIAGVVGEVFKTKTGEISIKASEIKLLSKSLQTLPEKFHGLKDPDLRYRQRYVDLIVNPEIKEVFLMRNKIIRGIREYLDGEGYLEVETPILSPIAGGANARPLITHHNTLDIDMYMRIANELFLKRLVVGGLGDGVYEMGKMFRNEGMDANHNPEYTAMEVYKPYADFNDMMTLTENIVAYVAKKARGTTKIEFQGKMIDFTPPWRRVKMQDLTLIWLILMKKL